MQRFLQDYPYQSLTILVTLLGYILFTFLICHFVEICFDPQCFSLKCITTKHIHIFKALYIYCTQTNTLAQQRMSPNRQMYLY